MRSWVGLQNAKYYLVQTMAHFQQFFAEFRRQKLIAVDTETSGTDWVRNHACGIVIGWGLDHNYYLPIRHQTTEPQLDINEIRSSLKQVLEDREVTKVFWYKAFDQHFLHKEGIEVYGPCYDGVPLVHLLDENVEKGLKSVSQTLIGPDAAKWEDALDEWRTEEAKRRRSQFSQLLKDTLEKRRPELERQMSDRDAGWKLNLTKAQITAGLKRLVKETLADHPYAESKKDDISYDMVPLYIIAPYACADTHYTYMCRKSLLPSLASHDQLRALYVNEMELSQCIYEVEDGGVLVNVNYLDEIEPEFVADIAAAEEAVYKDIGYRFKISSNEELLTALRTQGCKLTKLTKAGEANRKAGLPIEDKQFSVDKEVLEELATQYDFASKVQDYRRKEKLLNTYVRGIRSSVDAANYLHCSFNGNVDTGRMSSYAPNLQNIPNDDEKRDVHIRQAFVVPGYEDPDSSEYLFVFADASQVELRLTAHWSEDPTLLAAYSPDAPGWLGYTQDVHSLTCADVVMSRPIGEILSIYENQNHADYKEVKFFRNIAKRVNFGIIYGAGADAIRRQVSTPKRKVPREDCETYIKTYLQKYQGVKAWIDRTEFTLRRYGHLQNTFGRFRRLPNSQSSQKWERGRANRQGVNFLIQGDAADVFKTAVVRVRRFLKEHNCKTRIVNFVHDEIQFYWHKSELHYLGAVRKLMEDFSFRVPIVFDFAYSRTDWASKRELKH